MITDILLGMITLIILVNGYSVIKLLKKIDNTLTALVGYLAGKSVAQIATYVPPETITMTDEREWEIQQKEKGATNEPRK